MPKVYWLYVPRCPASATWVTSFKASWITNVYVSVNNGAVPVLSGLVSHTILPVDANVALLESVYVALLAVQVTRMSTFEGATESEV
jgi:hypothetical protein